MDARSPYVNSTIRINNMSIEIKPVRRKGAKLVIGLCGVSGSGKTYSALQVAYGLANKDASKVGLLDTENGRGSLYADIFDDPFMIADLTPPFSPARYIEAMRAFSESGIEVLVVDSMSHEWEGEGGCEEIAHSLKADGTKRKNADWLTAKREHKRFINSLLLMPTHVVACFRAREKTDFHDPRNPTSLGIQPITEKNVLFEMTASLMLQNEGRRQDIIKAFPAPVFTGNGYLTPEHGIQMREWIGGADPLDRSRNVLKLAATEGSESLKAAWIDLDKSTKTQLAAFKDTLKALADHADSERLAVIGDRGEPVE